MGIIANSWLPPRQPPTGPKMPFLAASIFQEFDTPGEHEYDKPENVTIIGSYVLLIAGGAGGGSGAFNVNNAGGAGGGSSGARRLIWLPGDTLAADAIFTVGLGGLGGPAVVAPGGGVIGGNGETTFVRNSVSNPTLDEIARGGRRGDGGSISAGQWADGGAVGGAFLDALDPHTVTPAIDGNTVAAVLGWWQLMYRGGLGGSGNGAVPARDGEGTGGWAGAAGVGVGGKGPGGGGAGGFLAPVALATAGGATSVGTNGGGAGLGYGAGGGGGGGGDTDNGDSQSGAGGAGAHGYAAVQTFYQR